MFAWDVWARVFFPNQRHGWDMDMLFPASTCSAPGLLPSGDSFRDGPFKYILNVFNGYGR